MRSINLVLLLFAGLIASCEVAQNPFSTEKPYRFHKDFTENGLITGSITFTKEKPLYTGYFIQVTNLDPDKKNSRKDFAEIPISPDYKSLKYRHAGQLENGKTYLFAIELPVGNHKISGIRFYKNTGYMVSGYSLDPHAISIPFEVKKGEILYVGNIFFNEYATENDTFIDYTNNYERDIEAIKKIIPTVNWDNTIKDETIKSNR